MRTIIEQIHNEFDFASELLLEEAVKQFQNDEVATKLLNIGFMKIKRVEENEKNNDAKRMVETVLYYKERYPFYKFITPEQVKDICKKYNLYLGDCYLFTGEIPQKNIEDILNFKLKEEDLPSGSKGWVHFSSRDNNFDRVFLCEGTWCEKKKLETIETDKQMKVCAPSDQFELSTWQQGGLSVKDGYMIVDDPIVLQPVQGGYLIVSKWGLEGQDELLINQKMN